MAQKSGRPNNGRKTTDDGQFRLPAFRVSRTRKLELEGTEWEGAEVMVRADVSMAQYLRLRQLSNEEGDASEQGTIALAQDFGDTVLLAWNLVDADDQPIPATGEGMTVIPLSLAFRVINLWLGTVAGVPAPLAPPSDVGNSLAALSTPLGSG